MILEILSPDEWTEFAEFAHRAVFGELIPKNFLRIDFAVLCIDDKNKDPIMYATCRETDTETVYWQYGGAVDKARRSLKVSIFYRKLIDFCWGKGYKSINTLVDANNVDYLELAMNNGFRIIGCRNWDGNVFVELCLKKPL